MVKVIQVKQFCGRNAWKTVISSKMWKALCDIIHKVERAICLPTNFHNVERMLTKLPQCGKFAKENSTMWKLFQQTFHNVERVITKPSQCIKYANKTPTMWKQAKKNFHNVGAMVTKLPHC